MGLQLLAMRQQLRQLAPAQLVAGSFLVLIILGTILLSLPISRTEPGSADLVTALFTATSATCLTGLVVVDTATYWTHFGQFVILGLIQLGGLGIMTLATIAGWAIAGQVGIKSRLNASAEGRGQNLGDVKTLIIASVSFTLAVEFLVGVVLTLRFRMMGFSPGASLWEGTFHSVSAFNNAGFGLRSDNLVTYASDPIVLLPISGAIILGGLGFPVLLEFAIRLRRRTQGFKRLPNVSITSQFILFGTVLLLVLGTIGFAMLEWNGVFKVLSTPDKLLNAFFQSVSTRTAGFNSVDFAKLHPSTLLMTDILMFIGGGSGGTAGGIKITTVAVLVAVMVAEIRGDEHTLVRGRRIPTRTMRQALAVLVLGSIMVMAAIAAVQLLAPYLSTNSVVFEVVSAFGTVGLSTGITNLLPFSAQLILVVLMYAGRIGPITLVAALTARERQRKYSYPVERPLIG